MTRRAEFLIQRATRAVKVLVGLACLTTLACDNSVSFNPVAAQWPDWTSSLAGARTLQVDGVLQIQDGSLLEATLLYDGLEVPGARSRCSNASRPRRRGIPRLRSRRAVILSERSMGSDSRT